MNKMVEGVRSKLIAQENIEIAEANWDAYVISLGIIAKGKKAMFDSLFDAGFTADQALKLTHFHFNDSR